VELLGLCILRTGYGLIRRAHCREGVGVGMRRWCRRATGSQALRQSLSRARRETVRSRIATSGAVHDAGWGKTSRGREVMDGKLDGTKVLDLRWLGWMFFSLLFWAGSHLRPAAPAQILQPSTPLVRLECVIL
jgi:hypothetical protein